MTGALLDTELALVRSTALLGQLSDDLLAMLLREAHVQEFAAGETLFVQGDEVEAFYIVLEGWIKLYRITEAGDEAVVSIFTRGQSFAEAAVFSMATNPVTADAVTRSRLLRLSRQSLQNNVRNNPEFAMSMLASVSRHLQELVRQIEQLKTLTGMQRVARFLAGLCPTEQGACTIGLPYDKALIANRLGMKPESLSRAFLRLRSVGVHIERDVAAIASVEQLKNFSQEDRSNRAACQQ